MPEERPTPPVYVIESIPVDGEQRRSPAAEIRAEGIPTPTHLRIYRELARGGMGRIHPATDRNLLRHVALKRLDKSLAQHAFYRDGFIAEAQITGQLEHPNIVPVHELAVARRRALLHDEARAGRLVQPLARRPLAPAGVDRPHRAGARDLHRRSATPSPTRTTAA